ncbi:RiPP maturation radical SAM C-methyltransferase [Thiovibrio sp. JS02]
MAKAACQHSPFRFGLVSLPWALFNRPSAQLGVLKSYLETTAENLAVVTLHPYLGLARALGPGLYHEISRQVWLCEGLYAGLLFPDQRPALAPFLARKLKAIPQGKGESVEGLWGKVEAHFAGWLAATDVRAFDLLGFSVCFNQLLSSLYAAREIKKIRPELPIVFGGSSCVAEMGRSLLATFPWLDYVVHGEGEQPLLHLCRVLAGESETLPAQVFGRQKKAGPALPSGWQLADLADLPIPDYAEYFRELRHAFRGEPFVPELPVEFSRGCWWGKCTFCNLNLQWHGYRSKSAVRMQKEIEVLAERHGCLNFCFTDNVLPLREAVPFFDSLAAAGNDFRFFAEIRINQRGGTLAAFRRGGLATVQAGIEALSQKLLERMRKGATVMENLALMKEAVGLGIRLDGNLITEFPLSGEDEVAQTLECLDYVLPFTPLVTAAFFLGHGCEVAAKPEEYGIRAIVQHRDNRKLFPAPVLRNLTLLINEYRGDRARQRKLWQPVVKKVAAWQRFHARRQTPAHLSPPLSYRDGGTFLLLRQELPGRSTLHHRLRGISRAIYLACTEIRELTELEKRFPRVGREQLLKFLGELAAKRLLFAQGTRYLALAVRERKNVE